MIEAALRFKLRLMATNLAKWIVKFKLSSKGLFLLCLFI